MEFVQLAMINWVAVPGRSSKSLPRVKLPTKKFMVPVWWSAAGMIDYNFLKWNESCLIMSNSLCLHGLYSPMNSPGHKTGIGSLSLPQGIFPTQGLNTSLCHWRKILYQLSDKRSPQLSESWQNHYIWEVCSTNQWNALKFSTTSVSTCQQNGPNSARWHMATYHTINTSKVEWIGLQSFALPIIITLPLTNWLPLLQASQQLFSEKILPQLAGSRKCFLRIHWILKHGFLCCRNTQTYLALMKMCWL